MESTTATLLVGGALIAALAAVVLAAAAVAGQRQVRRSYRLFSGGRREDVLTLLAASTEHVEALRRELDAQRAATEALHSVVDGSISRVGVVHYDAFPGMGGQMSFSAALLDRRGDGLVLSSITGRSESRTYLKAVLDGVGTRELSQEEREAIGQARAGDSRDGQATSAGSSPRGGGWRRPAVADAS